MNQTQSPVRVFISYAWESEEYRVWVRQLATRLRNDGVDARLDSWHLKDGDTVPLFMNREVREADKVLVLCSPSYRKKVHATESGAEFTGSAWESMLLTTEVFARGKRAKFVPVLCCGEWEDAAPSYLEGFPRIDLSDSSRFEIEYRDLLRRLTGKKEPPPGIGSIPGDLGREPVEPLVGNDALPAENSTPQGAQDADDDCAKVSRGFFVVGCAMSIVVAGLLVWGFGEGDLTPDQKDILRLVFPLALGFLAGSFVGAFFVKAQGLLPGVVAAGTGVFGVWFLSAFFLFPGTDTVEAAIDLPDGPTVTITTAPDELVRLSHPVRGIFGVVLAWWGGKIACLCLENRGGVMNQIRSGKPEPMRAGGRVVCPLDKGEFVIKTQRLPPVDTSSNHGSDLTPAKWEIGDKCCIQCGDWEVCASSARCESVRCP